MSIIEMLAVFFNVENIEVFAVEFLSLAFVTSLIVLTINIVVRKWTHWNGRLLPTVDVVVAAIVSLTIYSLTTSRTIIGAFALWAILVLFVLGAYNLLTRLRRVPHE